MVTGGTLGWTHGGQVSGIPPGWLSRFSSPIGSFLGIPFPPVLVLWLVIAIALGVILHLSVSGRKIYATGANEQAAVLAGIKTERVWIGSFMTSAVGSALVGIVLVGFTGQGEAGVGDPYLFLALAAVLVGGTSLVGARGDYWRTVLGALIMTAVHDPVGRPRRRPGAAGDPHRRADPAVRRDLWPGTASPRPGVRDAPGPQSRRRCPKLARARVRLEPGDPVVARQRRAAGRLASLGLAVGDRVHEANRPRAARAGRPRRQPAAGRACPPTARCRRPAEEQLAAPVQALEVTSAAPAS